MHLPNLPTEIIETESVENDIFMAYALRAHYPAKPKKPVQPSSNNPDDFTRYAKELAEYNVKIDQYYLDRQTVQDHNKKVDELVYSLIKKSTSFYDIPPQYQENAWEVAMEDAYDESRSYLDIYYALARICRIFH